MDDEPYSPAPKPEAPQPVPRQSRWPLALALTAVLAAGVGVGRWSAPRAPAPIAAPSAPQPAKDFSEAALGAKDVLVPMGSTRVDELRDEVVISKVEGMILEDEYGRNPTRVTMKGGGGELVMIDGEPARLIPYHRYAPDPRDIEISVRLKGRHVPHVVRFPDRVARWDGLRTTWSNGAAFAPDVAHRDEVVFRVKETVSRDSPQDGGGRAQLPVDGSEEVVVDGKPAGRVAYARAPGDPSSKEIVVRVPGWQKEHVVKIGDRVSRWPASGRGASWTYADAKPSEP